VRAGGRSGEEWGGGTPGVEDRESLNDELIDNALWDEAAEGLELLLRAVVAVAGFVVVQEGDPLRRVGRREPEGGEAGEAG
jgi:hypothetical protein